MVKSSWSDDKETWEKKKLMEIQVERVRQYNRLKNTPKFTVHSVTTSFNPVTREPYDYLTMQNGDSYAGKRQQLSDFIVHLIMSHVDKLLNLESAPQPPP
jgi:hypothetical protein